MRRPKNRMARVETPEVEAIITRATEINCDKRVGEILDEKSERKT